MRSVLSLLVFLQLPLVLSGCESPDERPHIIIIMADDMGFSDIAPYGGEIRTPHLQTLAAEGARFSQFYNNARCCPTRASLLTGLYPHRSGIGHMVYDAGYEGYQGDLSEESATIAEVLGAAGYKTYMSGKWHVTKQMGHWSGDSLRSKETWPVQRGFERFYGTILGAGSFFDPVTLTWQNEPLPSPEGNYHYTDAISDTAVSFIDQHIQTSDAPLFMYVSYTAPHWPLHAHPSDVAAYAGTYDKGWDQIREDRIHRMRAIGLLDSSAGLTPRDPRVPEWTDLDDVARRWYIRAMEVYAAQVEQMDQGIGRILNKLAENGLDSNTLVMFLADNGGCAEVLSANWNGLFLTDSTRDGRPVTIGNEFKDTLPGDEDTYMSYGIGWANASNTPFRMYKHWVHEGGIATPFIVRWPRFFDGGGAFVDEPGHVIDLMSTAIEAAGAVYPTDRIPLAGKSLLPALEQKAIERDALFWEHEGNRAVRQGKWKLVAQHNQPWELYDLEADRSELNDLINVHPEVARALIDAYEQWAVTNRVRSWPLRE